MPPSASRDPQRYDVNGDGKAELILTFDAAGKVDLLSYDEDENGTIDSSNHVCSPTAADFSNAQRQ